MCPKHTFVKICPYNRAHAQTHTYTRARAFGAPPGIEHADRVHFCPSGYTLAFHFPWHLHVHLCSHSSLCKSICVTASSELAEQQQKNPASHTHTYTHTLCLSPFKINSKKQNAMLFHGTFLCSVLICNLDCPFAETIAVTFLITDCSWSVIWKKACVCRGWGGWFSIWINYKCFKMSSIDKA